MHPRRHTHSSLAFARPALLPVAAVGALALVAAAFIVPMPKATAPVLVAPEPPAPAPTTTAGETAAPVDPWSSLTDTLAKLTDPPVETAPTETPEAQVAEASTPAAVPQPMLPPLSWRYKGTLEGPGSVAALIMTPSGSRIVFEGMSLSDDADPSGPGVTIKSISLQEMVVDRRGQDVTVPFEPPEDRNELTRRFRAEQTGQLGGAR
jgi:hypothetical protein